MHRKIAVPIVVALAGALAAPLPAFAWHPTNEVNALEADNALLSKQAATEGMVLLENNASLPIPADGNVALFGTGAYRTVKGGTGSGAVNNRYSVTVRQAFEAAGYTVTTSPAYWDAMTASIGTGTQYAAAEVLLNRGSAQPTAPTDIAIYTIARNSGEGSDRQAVAGDYYLNTQETANLQMLGQTYKNVVVVINSGGIIDTTFYKTINAAYTDPQGGPALDSLFLMSQAGQEGGTALVEVLNGTVIPSGKLTDTWASSYDYYPASDTIGNRDGNSLQENYVEGIYVGYRYFDSFYKSLNPADPASVVNYPFGYGLSYTDFSITVNSVTSDMETTTVDVTVKNTGTRYTGKDVVQVYFSAPKTSVHKPYQELIGYAKTDNLRPGASQRLEISFATTEMSSYIAGNATAASTYYRMDAGDYLIRVGHHSRDTAVAAVIGLNANVNTELLSAQITDQSVTGEWVSNPADFYTYPGENAQYMSAPWLNLSTAGWVTPDNRSAFNQTVTAAASSFYYGIDGNRISSVKAYLDPAQANWESTGAPYAPKSTEGESVQNVTVDPTKTLFDVARGDYPIENFVAGLNVTELANLVEGANLATVTANGHTPYARGSAGYTTPMLEAKGIAATSLADGPAGLRITSTYPTGTPTEFQYATAWPIGTLLAQTFNNALVEKVGQAIGKEMEEYGVTMWLAPGQNI
ncbi:MAG: glycoside hydrolase family 3 C-terminal domain-containing protein, partial [Bifidobacteriaceae bacterium]|nr:glycoside hydrolase family 3 C-terminal domain-containing protein [Bifidobacteriaceae bacterium]